MLAAVRSLVPTLVLPAPSGQATAQAHDAQAAKAAVAGAPAAHVASAAPAAQPVASRTSPATSTHPSASHAGGQLVTIEQLHAIMTTLPQAKASAYITPLNQAMAEFQINTRLRKAAFLGQVAHESGELKWFHEFASGMEYDISRNPKKAKELGNVNPGDGPRYKGRGPIQITGRNNYIKCGKAVGLDLVDHPDVATEPNVAFRTAGWFWDSNHLNPLADEGNYKLITRRINGGYNGLADRIKYYDRALAVFPA